MTASTFEITGSITFYKLNTFSYDTQEDVNLSILAVVSSDGSVMWIPHAVTRSRCTKEDQDWICTLRFGSWAYGAFMVDIDFYQDSNEVDLSDYVVSQWNVVGNSAVKSVNYYPCCEEPYADLFFVIRLSRNPSNSGSSNHGNACFFYKCCVRIFFLTLFVTLKLF